MLTKNGIYTNINESTLFYEYEGFRFYFSSESYRQKFKSRIELYIETEFSKLKCKYMINEDSFDLSIIKAVLIMNFYKRLEKRGYRVYWKGRDEKWQQITP